MNTPSKGELKTLMEEQIGHCISIFLPTHRGGAEMQQNPLRLRNAIREAANRLLLKYVSVAQTEALLEPMQALVEDEQFWLHPGDGLAVFRSLKTFRTYLLPCQCKEEVVVTNHFYLKPLLPFITNDEHFYILALSQNALRLLENTRYSVHEVQLPETVPQSLAETMKYKEPENEIEYHSSSSGASIGKGGRRASIFHGQGIGIDDEKVNILRYFQQIDRGLHPLLRDEKVPLVLAGVDYLFPLYREANTYPHLLEQGVPGNPDRESAESLHKRAWTIVEPYFMKLREMTAASYIAYAGTERASSDLHIIIPAAYYGRIESLFLAIDQEQWGTFNPATNTLRVHKEARFNDDDLLDIAATQTLLHGGSVHAVGRAGVPGNELVAALFRY